MCLQHVVAIAVNVDAVSVWRIKNAMSNRKQNGKHIVVVVNITVGKTLLLLL